MRFKKQCRLIVKAHRLVSLSEAVQTPGVREEEHQLLAELTKMLGVAALETEATRKAAGLG